MALLAQLYFPKVIRRAAVDLAESHRLEEPDTTGITRVDLGPEMMQLRRPTAACATGRCRPCGGLCWWRRWRWRR